MHEASGLLEDLKTKSASIENQRQVWEDTLNNTLRRCGLKQFWAIGKNASSFDIPILRSWGFATPFHHRVLDVGSAVWCRGEVPDLKEAASRKDVKIGTQHRALDDAMACAQICQRIGFPS